MKLWNSRTRRSQRHIVDLTTDFEDEDIRFEYTSLGYDSDNDMDTDGASDNDNHVKYSEKEREEEDEGFSASIPEFDVKELIDLANQLVANHVDIGEGSVRHRIQEVQSVNEARDIILNYERTNGVNVSNRAQDTGMQGERQRELEVTEEGEGDEEEEEEDDDDDENGGDEDEENTNHPTITPTTTTRDADSTSVPGDTQSQPMWLELTGLATVSMFLFAVYRLVATLVSISAYSDNVVNDVFEFVNYINEGGYYENASVTISDTLIFKFSNIIKEELPFLPDTIWMMLTLSSFSIYTLFTSGIVLTSMLFSAMCLSVCCIVRWKHLGDFVIKVYETL